MIVVALLGVMLFSGCNPEGDGPGFSDQKVAYLHFSMSGAFSNAQTRAQGDTPSIDNDGVDREDFVGELAVLVYKAETNDTNSKLVKSQFTNYKSFLMELEPEDGAKYHLCFVANYPTSWTNTLQGLKTYSDFKTTMSELRVFDATLYDGTTTEKFFPMARVYENQDIPTGGTITNPIPFQPKTEVAGSILPVSSWPSTETGNTQKTVNLVRTSAKISLNMTGEGLKDVEKVELFNVASQHSFMESTKSSELLNPQLTFKGIDKIAADATSYSGKLYVPERLIGKASENMGWDVGQDVPKGTPTYIQITMKSGQLYKIPVIVNGPMGSGYLDFARGDGADYSIVRNNHYKYDIAVPEDGKELQIKYEVMPWDLIESEMSYKRPKYSFELKVVNKISDNDSTETLYPEIGEVLLPENSYVDITFKISEPVGALWVASITNGLDFELTGNFRDVVNKTDIVEPTAKEYKMKIKPRAPFYREAKYTQFYIVAEGRELDLGIKADEDGKYMGEGGTRRWSIKQVLQ
ncbi:MAG: hypothetical protein ACOYEA_08675 [Fermentimonas sp.]